ncbi:hypothetical protein PS2015_2678 [Pseudohongiella spirulinae]|uniref:Uncharacterized protein n=2 Tax=Pseudohongiella spirulinae TaxID=1249552 RepID=A0A0S2KGS3_9GAMM|nr:hypothetical protein PS2015_2678 [Pseudohongiella spirulinae]
MQIIGRNMTQHQPTSLNLAALIAVLAMAFSPIALADDDADIADIADLDTARLNIPDPGSLNLRLGPELRLEAFPALSASEDTLELVDVSHEHALLVGSGQVPGLDVSASYVWESSRFGQFVLSTNTTYVYNTRITDAVSDTVAATAVPESSTLLGKLPELQSSVTFTWQFGNHTATAVTSYSDAMESVGRLGLDRMNVDQLNELVGQITTLDLRYGYNVRAGRQGNASFSLGLRNNFDRRPVNVIDAAGTRVGDTPDRVAYGTIKYQF